MKIDKKLKPLKDDHPAVGKFCTACQQVFQVGDVLTLIALGPGGDEKQRRLRDEHKDYEAVAITIHWECSSKKE